MLAEVDENYHPTTRSDGDEVSCSGLPMEAYEPAPEISSESLCLKPFIFIQQSVSIRHSIMLIINMSMHSRKQDCECAII
jgi:hypothetical protein